jgi:hypothetical protein
LSIADRGTPCRCSPRLPMTVRWLMPNEELTYLGFQPPSTLVYKRWNFTEKVPFRATFGDPRRAFHAAILTRHVVAASRDRTWSVLGSAIPKSRGIGNPRNATIMSARCSLFRSRRETTSLPRSPSEPRRWRSHWQWQPTVKLRDSNLDGIDGEDAA